MLDARDRRPPTRTARTEISERHRHRYEVNNDFREALTGHGMVISGASPDRRLVEMIELPQHPYFVGCQFHPEFKSRPQAPHPLFQSFIARRPARPPRRPPRGRQAEAAASAAPDAAITALSSTPRPLRPVDARAGRSCATECVQFVYQHCPLSACRLRTHRSLQARAEREPHVDGDTSSTCKLSQQLVMTPQLQQAIKLLQLSRMELVDMVRDEMLENPILEDSVESANEQAKAADAPRRRTSSGADVERVGETETPIVEIRDDEGRHHGRGQGRHGSNEAVNEIDWEDYLDNQAAAAPMPSYKSQQRGAAVARSDADPRHVAARPPGVAAQADPLHARRRRHRDADHRQPRRRRLPRGSAARGARRGGRASTLELAESVLEADPGVRPGRRGARDRSQECLLIQARHIGADDDVVVEHHHASTSPTSRRRTTRRSRKDLKQPVEEIYEAAKVIMELRPASPGAQYTAEEPTLHHARRLHPQGRRQVLRRAERRRPAQAQDLATSTGPRWRGGAKAQASTSRTSCASAQWLIRSIQQRQRTIVKVTESILKFQREFFDKGIAHLKPLILRDVAEDIGMHESTVSRVTTNKYVHTPQGIYELKYFFNSGIARTDGEDLASRGGEAQDQADHRLRRTRKHPHSDQRIVELLKDQNIEIARRTVAKYREQLGILSSSQAPASLLAAAASAPFYCPSTGKGVKAAR